MKVRIVCRHSFNVASFGPWSRINTDHSHGGGRLAIAQPVARCIAMLGVAVLHIRVFRATYRSDFLFVFGMLCQQLAHELRREYCGESANFWTEGHGRHAY